MGFYWEEENIERASLLLARTACDIFDLALQMRNENQLLRATVGDLEDELVCPPHVF